MAITTQMRTDVSQLYVGLFGRAPDGEGLGYWVQQLNAGQSMTQIADTMYATAPARAYFPSFFTNGEIIASFYQNVLGRPADADGLAFWTGKLNAPGATPGSVIAELINVVANYGGTDPAGLTSAALFTNKVAVAQWYGEQNGTIAGATAILSGVTSDPATVAAAESGSVTSGQTFTLTASPDNVVGTAGNDIINGYVNTTATSTSSTLTAADVINGGAGSDTLNITVEGNSAGALPAAAISGVENFYIRDVNTGGASTYDFANLDGEAQVWADRATSDMTLSNLATGTVVGLKGNGVIANANVTFEMAKATDAVSIALDGVKNGAAGADTVIATATGQATAATITTSGAASDVDQIELSSAVGPLAHTVKNVTINANANLTIGVADGTEDLIGFDTGATVTNTITITGTASSVKLNDVAAAVDAIDASAFAGGVTADASLATLASFKGGKGNDTLTVGTLTATGTVDLGAGDDVFKAAAGVVASTNSIDGGAGTDAFGLTAIDAGNLAKFSNFELVALDGLVGATNYDLSLLAAKNTITGLTIDAAATGGTVDKVAAGVGLKIVGDSDSSGLTIKVKDAATGTADSFNVDFAVPTSTPAGTAQTPSLDFTLNEVETLNIVSGGGADTTNSLTVRTATITQASATNKVTLTYNVSGANDLTLDAHLSAVANTKLVIDGSTATGKLDITGSSTSTVIKGGSAADIFTLQNDASVTVTGNGGKDKVDVSLVTYDTTAKDITTFADATAGDTIQTVGLGATAGTKLGAATDLAGATDLATILTTLEAAAVVASTDAAWATVGTDVYLLVSDHVAGVSGDNVIKLTGVSDLANWTVNATGLITIA